MNRIQKLKYSLKTIKKGLGHLSTAGQTIILAPLDFILNMLYAESYLDDRNEQNSKFLAKNEEAKKEQSKIQAKNILQNWEENKENFAKQKLSTIRSLAGAKGGKA